MTAERDSPGDTHPGGIAAARATPDGPGALAVVRLCGGGCADLVESCMSLSPGTLRGRKRALGSFEGIHGPLSRVVAISWPSGASYTGEEMVELICSGAPGVADFILGRLYMAGAGMAGPGEFTRRALLNGRVSPIEVMELSAAFRGSAGGGGSATAAAAELASALSDARAALDGAIEFCDSHSEGETPEAIAARIDRAVAAAAAAASAVAAVTEPGRVFITGPGNAGKSTLFNILAGRRAALVSDTPGTTREGMRAVVETGGGWVEIHDTAGWTEDGGLDAEALRAVLEEIREGDSVIWMSPRGADPVPPGIAARKPRLVEVSSRCDEGRGPGLNLSALIPEGIDDIRSWMAARPQEPGPAASAVLIEVILREAAGALAAGDAALASAMMAEADAILADMTDSPAVPGDPVDRALGSLCVGK